MLDRTARCHRVTLCDVTSGSEDLGWLLGAGLTWRVPAARVLRWIFVVYLCACVFVYLVPSEVGENIARLRFAAIPICILALSLRHWRPLLPCLVAFGLAMSWNLSPLAASFTKARSDPANNAAYWAPTIGFLKTHLTPDYRVEAVDTVGHWPAEYLPSAGIPIVRGWFRQDDFPQNSVLYRKPGRSAYVHWLRSLGVGYVVLPDASLDYSAQHEAALLSGGHSGLRVVYRTAHTTIYAVAYRPSRQSSGDQIEIWPKPLRLGQPLPMLPLALRNTETVPVDLEETYSEARDRSRLA